ncbi:MAG: hypothetical protein P4L73_20290 [Caulobacteraceae bacterium]|nr:hypothetical protein [Caulobacteraceae bacterium]
MNATIDRIKLTFLGLFVAACAAIFGYHYFYVWPKQRCEAHGDWWDDEDRVCAVPMPIWSFTHRMPGEAKAPAPAAAKPKAPQALKAQPKP